MKVFCYDDKERPCNMECPAHSEYVGDKGFKLLREPYAKIKTTLWKRGYCTILVDDKKRKKIKEQKTHILQGETEK
jgi:hypothetical protein